MENNEWMRNLYDLRRMGSMLFVKKDIYTKEGVKARNALLEAVLQTRRRIAFVLMDLFPKTSFNSTDILETLKKQIETRYDAKHIKEHEIKVGTLSDSTSVPVGTVRVNKNSQVMKSYYGKGNPWMLNDVLPVSDEDNCVTVAVVAPVFRDSEVANEIKEAIKEVKTFQTVDENVDVKFVICPQYEIRAMFKALESEREKALGKV